MRDKEKKAIDIVTQHKLQKLFETDKRAHYSVVGETETHSVILDKEKKKFTCDCKFFALQEKECSHIIACRLKENL